MKERHQISRAKARFECQQGVLISSSLTASLVFSIRGVRLDGDSTETGREKSSDPRLEGHSVLRGAKRVDPGASSVGPESPQRKDGVMRENEIPSSNTPGANPEASAIGHERGAYGYLDAMREVSDGAQSILSSEVELMRAELAEAAGKIRSHLTQVLVFGAVSVLGALPLLAFVVIALGNLMGGAYGLSSLIVGLVFAAIGGGFAYRGFEKIKDEDLRFDRTRNSLKREVATVQTKIDEVKNAVKGESYEPDRLH